MKDRKEIIGEERLSSAGRRRRPRNRSLYLMSDIERLMTGWCRLKTQPFNYAYRFEVPVQQSFRFGGWQRKAG